MNMTAKFEIFKGTNSQFYFRLKSGNGEQILASEGYLAKASCLNGVQSVKTHAPYDANYRRLTSSDSKDYFTLNATNGQVIGVSQMYSSKQGRDNGIAAVKRDAPSAPVSDLT
jgi:uncharacterized protein YegP (UPF0339 family)